MSYIRKQKIEEYHVEKTGEDFKVIVHSPSKKAFEILMKLIIDYITKRGTIEMAVNDMITSQVRARIKPEEGLPPPLPITVTNLQEKVKSFFEWFEETVIELPDTLSEFIETSVEIYRGETCLNRIDAMSFLNDIPKGTGSDDTFLLILFTDILRLFNMEAFTSFFIEAVRGMKTIQNLKLEPQET